MTEITLHDAATWLATGQPLTDEDLKTRQREQYLTGLKRYGVDIGLLKSMASISSLSTVESKTEEGPINSIVHFAMMAPLRDVLDRSDICWTEQSGGADPQNVRFPVDQLGKRERGDGTSLPRAVGSPGFFQVPDPNSVQARLAEAISATEDEHARLVRSIEDALATLLGEFRKGRLTVFGRKAASHKGRVIAAYLDGEPSVPPAVSFKEDSAALEVELDAEMRMSKLVFTLDGWLRAYPGWLGAKEELQRSAASQEPHYFDVKFSREQIEALATGSASSEHVQKEVCNSQNPVTVETNQINSNAHGQCVRKSSARRGGHDFREKDKPLIERADQGIKSGVYRNKNDAALALCGEMEGPGNADSKRKRLLDRLQKIEVEGQSGQG